MPRKKKGVGAPLTVAQTSFIEAHRFVDVPTLAKHTGLTEKQVAAHLATLPRPQSAARRAMMREKGVVAMTEQASEIVPPPSSGDAVFADRWFRPEP